VVELEAERSQTYGRLSRPSQWGMTNRSDLSGSSKSRARLPEFFLVHVRLLLLQGEVSPPWLSSQDETKIPGENTELGPPVHLLRESVRPLGLT
jgi:hypothetical protein